MALTPAPVSVWPFLRLKLRITGNGLRGRTARIVMFVFGAITAGVAAIVGYAIFAIPGMLADSSVAEILFPFGGAFLVLGWLFLPLLFFGVDSSLDPAQFALLPIRRRTLLAGLAIAAVAGLPALATLAATAGTVDSAARLGGPGAAVAQFLGVVCGLLLCVLLSRAMTSAFATALRSRRSRDMATILLAVVAASIGPAQLLLLGLVRRADWDAVSTLAAVTGWTPLGAAYTIGLEVVAGRLWAVPVKLLIVLATAGALAYWWSRTLEKAMAGTAGPRGRDATARGTTRGPVDQLLFRWLPRSPLGALVARETRYWWRETRRRAALITLSVAGVFLPVSTVFGTGGTSGGGFLALLIGALAPISLVNQFGYEGSAYATNLATGVPGRLEVHSRAAAHAVFTLPLLLLVAVVTGLAAGRPEGIAAQLGTLLATYGFGLALVLPISVLAAYALPDPSTPFAISSGGGFSKALPSVGAMFGALLGAIPVAIVAYLLGPVWLWVGLPLGLAYGVAAYLIGAWAAGGMLDRRMPEVLAAVTTR